MLIPLSIQADNAALRLDKFKTWHSIRRIPLFACRGWQPETVQCLNDLYANNATHRRLYPARNLARALAEPRLGHTRGSWQKCVLNISVDVTGQDQVEGQMVEAPDLQPGPRT